MKQTQSTKKSDIKRDWHIIDVGGQILGRISTRIAKLLMGKSKPYYVPYLDCGDYVVVINATKTVVTGKKAENKKYMKYSGYPHGLKVKTFNQVMVENPTRIIRESVSGMLPQNKLKDSMLRRLYVFKDENHSYKNRFKS
jgi:large subunit ribosomal protein L13